MNLCLGYIDLRAGKGIKKTSILLSFTSQKGKKDANCEILSVTVLMICSVGSLFYHKGSVSCVDAVKAI